MENRKGRAESDWPQGFTAIMGGYVPGGKNRSGAILRGKGQCMKKFRIEFRIIKTINDMIEETFESEEECREWAEAQPPEGLWGMMVNRGESDEGEIDVEVDSIEEVKP